MSKLQHRGRRTARPTAHYSHFTCPNRLLLRLGIKKYQINFNTIEFDGVDDSAEVLLSAQLLTFAKRKNSFKSSATHTSSEGSTLQPF